ncbi:hypothetical protein [Embleya sp. NPDC059237]
MWVGDEVRDFRWRYVTGLQNQVCVGGGVIDVYGECEGQLPGDDG